MTTYAVKLSRPLPYNPTENKVYYVSYREFKLAWKHANVWQKDKLKERYPAWAAREENR